MGLFDRFKRKKAPEPAAQGPEETASGLAPSADTSAVILLGEDVGWTAVTRAVENRFGSQALVSADSSAPNAPAMTLLLEGVEFFCS